MMKKNIITFLLGAIICEPLFAAGTVTYNSGSGFFVTRDGYVITNHHVVDKCKSINVSGPVPLSDATLVAEDVDYDLALLKTHASAPDEARLSSVLQPLQENDPVLVIGYPGESWKTGRAQVCEARILKNTGPHEENKWFEFTDSLVKGNSGGPLLDSSGNVVGVVVAKARLVSVNRISDRQESIDKFDIAISLPILRQFLYQNRVNYAEADSSAYFLTSRITDDARRYTVNVRCQLD